VKNNPKKTAAFWPHLLLSASDSPPPSFPPLLGFLDSTPPLLGFSGCPFIVLRLSGPSIVLSSLSLFAASLSRRHSRVQVEVQPAQKLGSERDVVRGKAKEADKPRRVIRLH